MAGQSKTTEQGLAMYLLELFQRMRGANRSMPRQMQVIETLAVGGKQRLSLVQCAGEHFLVGGGPDCVQTIVRLHDGLKRRGDQQCA